MWRLGPSLLGGGQQQVAALTPEQRAKLRRALKILVDNCGPQAEQILPANPSLSELKAICQLSRTSQERQQFEIGQVAQGKHLFSVKSTAFDTVSFGEVGSRLARGGGLVNCAKQFFVSSSVWRAASPDEQSVVKESVTALCRRCGELYRLIRVCRASAPTGAEITAPGFRWKAPRSRSRGALRKLTLQNIQGDINRTDSFVSKCSRDLLNTVMVNKYALWPSRAQTHSCCVKLYEMIQHLHRIAEVLAQAAAESPEASRGRTVLTHQKPDVDALTAVWLVEHYLFRDFVVEVVFVPYDHDFADGQLADCVVDMAGLYEPRSLLFDHKPPAFADRHESCATRLVWEHLFETKAPIDHLEELAHMIHAGDSVRLRGGNEAYQNSRRSGLHAHVAGVQNAGGRGAELYAAAREWLDDYNRRQRTITQRLRRHGHRNS